jgi:elongator complex protein 4
VLAAQQRVARRPFASAMSSFKRKTTAKSPAIPAGTRIAPGSSSTLLTSTGVASLDDLLGGGQPLGTTLSLLAPDAHSAIGVLCVKYALAQTLASGQRALVVDGRPGAFVKDCVWLAGRDAGNVPAGTAQEARHDDDAGTNGEADGGKIKIAWRYEGMKQFQTTVPAASVCESIQLCGDAFDDLILVRDAGGG